MVLAFHGEASLKSAVMSRLREHRRMDEIVQGIYFDEGRGCHLGCITHANEDTHLAAERLFGIEQRVGYWLESVFEGLPKSDCAAWVIESTEAIPVGADLSKCHNHFCAWLLGESGLLTITDGNRAAIEQVAALHRRAAAGGQVSDDEWSSAESAAWSARSAAAWSAWSAGSAAESAAWSARSAAAWSAWSAGSAARSAARSAWSAAAAWKKIAAKSIEIFRAAPVSSEQPAIEQCVQSELCARSLWCPDGELVLTPGVPHA